ncbi:hypothetical protein [Halarcobacter bivalviorum]|uniref:Uncharacterized protein n=1 Tax=Halarcobacter bivalviorum TaxID=663364 RepID=A0AAX2ACW2_9BACT|nr:hypothetical protein [Halarcobacter bivalviorum]AXH12219.1 hypothetical protein ABIV_1219 [Halarcobacter bivalviorum]RXK11326.1 hypothetical protein CRV05_02860 [Halarcobacter bivalviorum]
MQEEISLKEASSFMSSWVSDYKKEQKQDKYQSMLDKFSKEDLVKNYEELLYEKFILEDKINSLEDENKILKEENERLKVSLLVSTNS